MVINPIGSGINGITADPLGEDVKPSQNPSYAHEQGVQTTLSSDRASVETLVSQAMQPSKLRQERVEALRVAVGRGNYSVDPAEVAAAVAKHYAS